MKENKHNNSLLSLVDKATALAVKFDGTVPDGFFRLGSYCYPNTLLEVSKDSYETQIAELTIANRKLQNIIVGYMEAGPFTLEDMERAFAGGGANAAKLRVSDNNLTLPSLEFNQWIQKYTREKKGSHDNTYPPPSSRIK